MLSASTTGAAFLRHQVGQRQILPFDRHRGIDQHDDAIGKADGAQRIRHREFFDLALNLRLAADAGRVPQLDVASAIFPVGVNGIAGDAGLGPRQHAFFAQHGIDQRGLAGVGLADDGQPQGPRRFLFLAGFFAFGLLRLLRHEFPHDVTEVANAFAMLSRDGDGIAQPKAEGFQQSGFSRAAFRLVGDEPHRLAQLAHIRRQLLVERCRTRCAHR